MTSIFARYGFIAISMGLLVACGGGGGGGGGAASRGSSTGAAASNPALATQFSDIVVPANFSWGNVQLANAVTLTVSTTTAANVGSVHVMISNYIDKDPTGSDEPITPMSTDVIAAAIASNATGPSVTVSFGALSFPAGTYDVLLEVFDMADGARLTSSKVAVSTLMASSLQIDI